MVLSDGDILKALKEGRLIINPTPKPRAYGTTTVDLHVGDEFLRWDIERLGKALGTTPPIRISHYNFGDLADEFLTEVPADPDGYITMKPGDFFLATTMEEVGFPKDGQLAGRVEGKSSLARLGLSVHFAPTLHADWRGQIALELHYIGGAPIQFQPGDPICQLIVESVSSIPGGTMGGTHFQGQTSARGVKSP